MARLLPDLLHGIFPAEPAFEMGAELGVADKLEWFSIRGDSPFDQVAGLFGPARCEHRFDAGVGTNEKGCARRKQADLYRLVAFEGVAAAAMNFAYRLAGQNTHLDSANHFGGVARRNAGGGGSGEPREDAVEVCGATELGFATQAIPQFLRARGSIGQAIEKRA